MPVLDAKFFDEWYSNAVLSAHDEAMHAPLGLPPGVVSNSLLSGSGLNEVIAELALEPTSSLLDMGCGRGGYTLEIVRRTHCSVVGIDHSAVAIGVATEAAAAGGMSDRAKFYTASLTDTLLADHSVDAVVSIDALPFARPMTAGLDECLRILKPGGRLVFTGWDPREHRVFEDGRTTRPDAATCLRAAGFTTFTVHDKEDWLPVEREIWQTRLALPDDGDPFLASAKKEAINVLETFDFKRRVLAVAVAPPK